MGRRRCGCVYADSRNSAAVRNGFVLSGSLLRSCPAHTAPAVTPEETSRRRMQAMQCALVDNVLTEVNRLVDQQRRLHPDLLQAAVNMQVEAYRLQHMAKQMADGKYRPAKADGRRGCKGGPAGRMLKEQGGG